MRRYKTVSLFFFLLIGCTNMNPPVVADETVDISMEELYLQSHELKGIGGFSVGRTTLNQALKNPECNLFEQRNNFTTEGKWCIPDYDEARWMEKNHPEFARYLCSGYPSYSKDAYCIGDYYLKDMFAVFYKGVLAAVTYDCSNDHLYDLLSEKYGKGNGEYHYFLQENNEVHPKYRRRHTIYINKVWENETVKMSYYFNRSQVVGYQDAHVKETHNCLILDKSLYPIFEKEFLEARDEYKANKDAEKSKTESRI